MVVNIDTVICRVSTYREDMRNKGIGKTLFSQAKRWAKQKGAENFIYLHILPLRAKPSIKPWGVLRQSFIIKSMLKMNRMIVNWNVFFNKIQFLVLF